MGFKLTCWKMLTMPPTPILRICLDSGHYIFFSKARESFCLNFFSGGTPVFPVTGVGLVFMITCSQVSEIGREISQLGPQMMLHTVRTKCCFKPENSVMETLFSHSDDSTKFPFFIRAHLTKEDKGRWIQLMTL